MKLEAVQEQITELKYACQEAGVIYINRFYFDGHVIFNVTTKDGLLASAQMVKGELLIKESDRKDNRVDNSAK